MNDTDRPLTATVIGLYSAVLSRDLDQIAAHVHEDLVLHVPGTHALAGDHVGAPAVLAFLDRSRALTDDGEHIEVLDVLEGNGHAAVYCRVTADRAGRASLDNRTIHLLRVVDGRVAELWFHNWDDRAVDGFWS